jgi:glycosyltransferase involved in cell wall biosynthesis
MKILALSSEFPPFRGGIGTYAAEIARAAHEQGAEITMVAPDYGQDLAEADRRDYPFEVIRFAGGAHRTKDTLAKIALLRRLLSKHRYDAVHAVDWPFFLPAAIWARGVERIYTLHGSDVLDMARPAKRAATRLSHMFSGNVRILGNSRFTADLFRQHFPAVAAERIGYEHLGASGAWLAHQGSRKKRAALGLPADKLVLLTVARVTRRKGHLTALAALHHLPASVKEKLFYAIVGPSAEADYRSEVEAAIATSPVPVQRFEDLDNAAVMDMCAASDIFCLPGARLSSHLVEGFGLVFLEAGAQGLTSIAGQIGGVAEVVDDGVSGLVVPTDDPAALAQAITRLVEDDDLRRRLAAGARTRAEALTWQRCAAATYRL